MLVFSYVLEVDCPGLNGQVGFNQKAMHQRWLTANASSNFLSNQHQEFC